MLDLKSLLAKMLDIFKTTNTTLTGSYNLKAVAYRRCGIVTINIWQTAWANIPKGTWITVGTLPEEYRPLHQLDTLGVDNNTSSVQNNSLQLRIPTSGEVRVWAYSNGVTTNQLLSTVTFIGGGYLTSKFYSIFSHLERWWEHVRLKGFVGESVETTGCTTQGCVSIKEHRQNGWQPCRYLCTICERLHIFVLDIFGIIRMGCGYLRFRANERKFKYLERNNKRNRHRYSDCIRTLCKNTVTLERGCSTC